MRRSVRVSWLLVVVIGLAGVASMSLAGSARASDKDWCKQGGWTDFRDQAGASFKNQGQCVSYVATGGRLFVPTTLAMNFGGPASVGEPTVFPIVLDVANITLHGSDQVTVDAAGLPEGEGTCTAVLTAGKGSCDLTFPTPGTYTVTASFAGDTKTDPGLLPSSLKATVVVLPCTDGLLASLQH